MSLALTVALAVAATALCVPSTYLVFDALMRWARRPKDGVADYLSAKADLDAMAHDTRRRIETLKKQRRAREEL